MKPAPKDIDLLLLDFDGTFYSFPAAFTTHCNEGGARTAIRLGAPLDMPEAVAMAEASHLEFGSSLVAFQRKYGFRTEDCHEVYHQEISNAMIEGPQVTLEHLQASGVPMALLSHSNRPWILAMLKKFGMQDLFPPERIFGLEDVGFNLKMTSDAPYRIVLNKLGARPERSIMVEDTLHNLTPAKKLGMTTIYLKQGRSFEAAAHPDIDYAYDILPDFLTAFGM